MNHSPTPTLAPAHRMPGLDVLRIVAALAIVCIHVPETEALRAWTPWCRFAVPAFTTMSTLLLVLSLRRHGDGQGQGPRFLARRFGRLYALFLVWNGIYLAARLLKKHFLAGDALRFAPGTIFFSGFAEHLWYLAFIAWFSLVAGGCALLYLRLGRAGSFWWAGALAAASLAVAVGVAPPSVNLDGWPMSYFLRLGFDTLLAGCAGLLLAWVWEHRPAARTHGGVCALCAVAGVACLSMAVAQPAQAMPCDNLAGICLTAAALTLPLRRPPAALGVAAALTLPVYCVHVLIIEGMQPLAHRLQFGKSVGLDAAVFVVAVAGGVAFGLVLRGPLRRTRFAALHR